MKIHIVLYCCLVLLGGCSGLRQVTDDWGWETAGGQQSGAVMLTGHDLLVCLDETQSMERETFEAEFASAEKKLEDGREKDIARFICLSLHTQADYEQFKHGTMILEQYLTDQPESGRDLQGLRILLDRLDYEIRNKWSSWKTLLNDKKTLKAEIVSLQVRVEELQKQIDQLKNIEEIIKSREMDHQ